jgi:hypothetical protein
MSDPIPITPMFDYYSLLHFKGAGREGKSTYQLRLKEAKLLLRDPAILAAKFEESVAQAQRYFRAHDFGAQDFYPTRREFKKPPGIESTDALGHWLKLGQQAPWRVLGDDSLSFYYLDRELVPTRAPGARLADGRSTSTGPRLDLLLANAEFGRPIVGEVKLTSRRGSPDKDSFFALIQALTAAAYLLPANQQARLRRKAHDPEGRLDTNGDRLDLYLLTGDAPPHSPAWFELRDCAERLAAALAPQISSQIHTIASLELSWFVSRPAPTRLRITKRFSYINKGECR